MQDSCGEDELVVVAAEEEVDGEIELGEALELTIVTERLELRDVVELEDELTIGHRADDWRQFTIELPCVKMLIVFVARQTSAAGWRTPAPASAVVHRGTTGSRAKPL
jgi:hypothetical protein